MNIYVFLGPPGVGKGSLSQLCIEKLGWKQLSTGNLCRIHIAKQTEIGKKIDFIIKSGKLIPDDLMIEMVTEWLEKNFDNDTTIILDGYPRTALQAESIHNLIKNKFDKCNFNIIKFIISEDSVIERLRTRLICSNKDCQAVYSAITDSLVPKIIDACDKCNSLLIRRTDDEEKAIKERLMIYNKHEKDLLDFYSKIGQKVINLNVEKQLNEVFRNFRELIN